MTRHITALALRVLQQRHGIATGLAALRALRVPHDRCLGGRQGGEAALRALTVRPSWRQMQRRTLVALVSTHLAVKAADAALRTLTWPPSRRQTQPSTRSLQVGGLDGGRCSAAH